MASGQTVPATSFVRGIAGKWHRMANEHFGTHPELRWVLGSVYDSNNRSVFWNRKGRQKDTGCSQEATILQVRINCMPTN